MHACKATTSAIVPLKGQVGEHELRQIEDRLAEISLNGKTKAQRGDHLIPPVADSASGASADRGSAARDKLCAMRQRIRLKEFAASEASRQESPEDVGNSQFPHPL